MKSLSENIPQTMNSPIKFRLIKYHKNDKIFRSINSWVTDTWDDVMIDFSESDLSRRIFVKLNHKCETFDEWKKYILENPEQTVRDVNAFENAKYRYVFTRDSELLDILFDIDLFDPY